MKVIMKIALAFLIGLRIIIPLPEQDPLEPEDYYAWETSSDEPEVWDPVMDYGHEIFEEELLELPSDKKITDKEYL